MKADTSNEKNSSYNGRLTTLNFERMVFMENQKKDIKAEAIGNAINDNEAEIINYCISNSWDMLTDEERVDANKLLLKINKPLLD